MSYNNYDDYNNQSYGYGYDSYDNGYGNSYGYNSTQSRINQLQTKRANKKAIGLIILIFLLFPCIGMCCVPFGLLGTIREEISSETEDLSYEFSSIDTSEIPSEWRDDSEMVSIMETTFKVIGFDMEVWEYEDTEIMVAVTAIDLSSYVDWDLDTFMKEEGEDWDYEYEIYSNGNTWKCFYDEEYIIDETTGESYYEYDYTCVAYNADTNCVELVQFQDAPYDFDDVMEDFLSAYDDNLLIYSEN